MLETVTPTTDPSTDVSQVPDGSIETAKARASRFRRDLRERQKGQGTRLLDYLRQKRDYYKTLDSEARRKHRQDIDLMFRYFQGDQYGDYNEAGYYEQYTLQDGDYAYTIPVLNGHVEQAFSQLLKTTPVYEFSANEGASASKKGLARMCEELATEDYERLMDEDTRQEELLYTILAGESYRCLMWAPDPKRPRKVKRLLFKTERVTIEGRRECQGCKSDVPAAVAACPACGSEDINEIPAGETSKTVQRGSVEVTLGRNQLHIPHPLGVQRDLSARRLEHSPFIVERDSLPKHVAEWAYQMNVAEGQGLGEEARLIREQERSSMQTDAIVGSGRTGGEWNITGQVERTRHFLDVAEYGAFYCDQEETLPNGKKIPAGTFLGEALPDGMFFSFLGDTLEAIEPVLKWRKWSLVRYGRRPGSGRGSGFMTGIPLQDIVNDTFNLDYAILMTYRPLTALYKPSVKELPEINQFLFIDKLPANARGVGDAVAQFPGQAPSGAVGATSERIQSALQFILGTQSVIGQVGAPDAAALGTATGIAATLENSSLRATGPVGQRVAADKELLFQILENIQEYSAPEQWKELERRFGPDTVSAFRECNFRAELTIGVAKGTDRPRSAALTQAALMAVAQVAPALAQVPWGMELLSALMEELGIPLDLGAGRNDRREAEYRLNKLEAMEERLRERDPALLADAEGAAEKMYAALSQFCGPLVAQPEGEDDVAFMFLQDHTAFMDAYKDYLFGERAKTASEALKMVVLRLWQDHFTAQAAQKFELAELQQKLQAASQPPPPEGPTEEDIATQKVAELTEEGLKREADEEAKDADLERELTKQEHQAMLAQRAQGNGAGAVGPVG